MEKYFKNIYWGHINKNVHFLNIQILKSFGIAWKLTLSTWLQSTKNVVVNIWFSHWMEKKLINFINFLFSFSFIQVFLYKLDLYSISCLVFITLLLWVVLSLVSIRSFRILLFFNNPRIGQRWTCWCLRNSSF